MAHKIGFTRWYDSIPELAQAVRLLERADETHRRVICESVIAMQEYAGVTVGNEDYGLKKLGAQKVMGLMKSKSKRRWYDQEPAVHRAFNTLYLMDDALRYEAAIRILVSLKALEQYHRHMQETVEKAQYSMVQNMSPQKNMERMQKDMVKAVFYQSTDDLLGKIYAVRKAPEESLPKTLPGFQEDVTPTAGRVIDSSDGMKLGGLNLKPSPRNLI